MAKMNIGYSMLTDRILLGRINEEKGEQIEEKRDITERFLNVCFEYFPEGEVRSIDTPNKNKTNMFINVSRSKEDIEKTINFLKKELEDINKLIDQINLQSFFIQI